MAKKFGAPGNIENFGLRSEETMSQAEKTLVTDMAVKAIIGNLEERESSKKHLQDFFGIEQTDKNLWDWAVHDKHFRGIVSLCDRYADRGRRLEELERDLSMFGVKDQSAIDNFLNIVFKYRDKKRGS